MFLMMSRKRFPDSSLSVIWPFDEDGVQKNWHYAAPRAKDELKLGKLSVQGTEIRLASVLPT